MERRAASLRQLSFLLRHYHSTVRVLLIPRWRDTCSMDDMTTSHHFQPKLPLHRSRSKSVVFATVLAFQISYIAIGGNRATVPDKRKIGPKIILMPATDVCRRQVRSKLPLMKRD